MAGIDQPRRNRSGHARLVAAPLASGTPMAAAVNDYLGAIAAKGFSTYTIAYRSRSLAHLVAWLAERGVNHPGDVSPPVLERYQRSLFHHRKTDGSPLSFRTQVSYLVPVKALFAWPAKTHRIAFNPASELEMPRIERRLPRAILNLGEIEAVLATAELGDPVGLRDRAIMEVAYSTGMRRGELCHPRLDDVDVERGVVAVRQGKGHVHADAMGSTRVLTTAGGSPVLGYTYDPYGQATVSTLSSSTIAVVNPFMFQGQYVDAESGLIYLRARYYDPTTGQFLLRVPTNRPPRPF